MPIAADRAEPRMSQQPLDHLPLLVVVLLCIGVTLAFYEVGYRIGRWRVSQQEGR